MKKAKILIPSLSLLCFSAIACVTGSVAWFTSVSNAHVATSSFSVKSLDGNMNLSVYHGVGTKATLEGAKSENEIKSGDTIIGYKGSSDIVVKPDTYKSGEDDVNNVLTHGSYDSAHKLAYTVQSFSSTEYKQVTDQAATKANEAKYRANDTEGYYHIFTFDLKFTYDFKGATSGKYNLFFDPENSKCNRAEAATLDVSKGYRMAFINLDTTGDWVVWSPFQGKTWTESSKTVNSHYVGKAGTATTISKIDYDPATNGNLIYENEGLKKITESTGSAKRKDCLGTFNASASSKVETIDIRVVVWYEGEDPNISNDATPNAVAATLDFYLRGYAE